MLSKLKDWFSSTLLEVEAQRPDLALVLRASLLVGASLSVAGVVAAFGLRMPNWERLMRDAMIVLVIALLLWLALRQGYRRLAAYGTILGFSAFAAFSAYTGVGVRGTSYGMFMLIVMVAALFLNRRIGYLMAVVASLVGLGLVRASAAGLLVNLNRPLAEPATWSIQVAYFFITALILDIALSQIARALEQARRELAERKQAEERFRTLVDATPTALIMVGQDGRIALANKPTELLFGYTREELRGQPIEKLMPERFRGEYAASRNGFEAAPQARRMGVGRDLFGLGKDGHEVPIEIGLNLLSIAGEAFTLASIIDITERKQVEEEIRRLNADLEIRIAERTAQLAASEERYRLISSASSDYVFATEVTPTGELHYGWSGGAFESIIGYTFEEYVARGGWLAILHPDDVTRDAQNFAILHANQPSTDELRVIAKSGAVRWVRVSARPVWDSAQNRLARIYGAVQDITERKQAEEALRRSEDLYRRAIMAAGAVPYYLDLRTQMYTFMGEGILDMTNYSAAEMTPALWNSLEQERFPRGALADLSYADAERLTEEGVYQRWECDYRIRTRDDQLRWIADTSVQVRDEQNVRVGVIGILQDITGRKQIEQALQEAEWRFRTLVEQIPAITYLDVADNQGHTVYASPQVQSMLGVSPEEWQTGDIDFWLSLIHPADREVARGAYLQSVETGEAFDMEYRMLTRAGRQLWVHDQAVIRRAENGQSGWVHGLIFDITEHKQAVEALHLSEQAMREFQEKLKALHEINLELAAAATLDDLYRRAVELGRAQLGLDRFGIFLLDDSAQTIIGTFGTDAHGQLRDERHLRRAVAQDSAIQRVLKDKERIRVWEDAPLWDKWGIIGHGWNALAAIWDGDRAIGWLATDNLIRQEPFRPYQAELLMLYGATIGSLHRRKQAEAALVYERDLMQALMDNIPDAIYFKDMASRFIRVNRGFARVLNVAHPQTVLGLTDFDVQPQPLAQAFFDEEQAMLQSGQPIIDRIEFNPTADGQPRWLSATKAPMRDQAGQMIGLVGVSRDVTERELARQMLAKQANEMATVARVSAAASTLLDPAELLQTVADLTKESFGLYHTHIYLLSDDGQTLTVAAGAGNVGRQMRAEGWRIPLDHTHSIVARAARTQQGALVNTAQQSPDFLPNPLLPHTQAEIVVPMVIGEQLLGVFDVQSEASAGFSEADVPVYTALARQLAVALQNARLFELAQTEIRERQKAETLIRQRADEFETLYQTAQMFITQMDLAPLLATIAERAQNLLKAENGFVFLYAAARDELEYKVSRVIPAQGQRVRLGEGLAGQVAQTRAPKIVEDYHTWAGRSAVFEPWPIAAILGVPMLYGGTLVGVLGVENYAPNTNKFAEADARLLTLFAAQAAAAVSNTRFVEQIRRNAAELEERVAERTEELQLANDNLAKAARLKDEFLASMSHELRTPLTGILAFAQTLQKPTVYGALNEKQLKAARTIEDSGKHLLELINDILDLAKIEAGKFELEMSSVMVDEIAQASLRLVRQMAVTKRQTLSYSLTPIDLRLLADARRLKQMLVNLLSNAVKFTPEGGEFGLEINADPAQGVVRFTVWDKGIGIAPENFERLFQSFVQIDARLARQYEGTGLGLTLVHRMSELHGGSVAVESAPGQGSRFTITLPWRPTLAPEPPLVPTAAFVLSPEAHWPQRVLTVEDSPVAAQQLTDYLTELGLVNIVHAQAQGAVEKAVEAQVGVVLLDILMPDEPGWNVLARLKTDPRTQHLPVIIMSILDDRAHSLQLGADEYLVKPVGRADLSGALDRVKRRLASPLTQPALVVAISPTHPHLLLAEDNEVNIQVLSDYLEASGYALTVARNGHEAVRLAHEVKPQLILMDIQMPGMDGLEATRRIRQDAALARVPIIALTALAMPGDRERCLTAGANDYLTKPVNLEQLVENIRALLKK